MIPMLYSVYILDSNIKEIDEIRSRLLFIAYICPLWFGLAHMHHFYQKITAGGMTIMSAIITTLIQLTYTTIFGFIATLLFMRTGNIIGKFNYLYDIF
jgi:membrane protease YdiL (CAAX protease family)